MCRNHPPSKTPRNRSSMPNSWHSFTQHIAIIAFDRSRHPLLEHPLSGMVGQTPQLAHLAITTQKARFLPQNRFNTRPAEPETARPKTYQNLIHNLKNRCSQSKARKHSRNRLPDVTQVKPFRNLLSSQECPSKAARPPSRRAQWWRRAGSNR